MRIFNTIPLMLMLVAASGCEKLNSSSQSSTQSPAQVEAATRTVVKVFDATAKEPEKLVGSWQAVDGEYQGARMNPASLKDIVWTFSADKVSFSMLGNSMEATYSVQPDANPKTFDFKGSETAIQGIYELKGDTLRVCCAATERPSGFSTGGTTQDTLMFTFKRSKGAASNK